MEHQLFVYMDMGRTPVLVGRLWTRRRQRAESATFLYDAGWLRHPDRFALEPALPLSPAPYHTPPGKALFGGLADSAPDRWGRELMRRQWRREQGFGGRADSAPAEVDFLRQHGARPRRDMHALWRRAAFNVLISNTDDHLRNHALLRAPGGWALSPAYDLNPVPVDVKPRVLSTGIVPDDAAASLELAMEAAPYFGLDATAAQAIAAEIGAKTAAWRTVAKSFGLPSAETERMASAFEHGDLEQALRLRG